jgi:protein-disulfide isomerase
VWSPARTYVAVRRRPAAEDILLTARAVLDTLPREPTQDHDHKDITMAQSKKKKPTTFSKAAPTSAGSTPASTEASSGATTDAPKAASTKATQRELLKEQRAREAREKKIRTGITYGIIGVVVVALIVGLIYLIPNLTAKTSTTAASGSDPYAITIGKANAPVTIDIYQDYMCPYCGQFERAQTSDLKVLTESGTAKVVFHVMAFLDDNSSGTKYSTRAANAFVVVAQKEPDKALAFNSALFTNQPSEGSTGLTDEELVARAKSVGVSDAVTSTFASLSQADFVKGSNDAAFAAGIQSTPTVKVNGTVLSRNLYSAGSLRAAAEKAAGK